MEEVADTIGFIGDPSAFIRGRRIFKEGVAGVEVEAPDVGTEERIEERDETGVEEGAVADFVMIALALASLFSFALWFRSERST